MSMAERDEAAEPRERDLDEAPDGEAADDDDAVVPPPATAPRRAAGGAAPGPVRQVNTPVQGASKPASPSRSGAETREADLELVRRAQKGDVKAFEDLLGRYRRKVYGLAMGMVGNRDDAMDVMQDAFVRVFRHLNSFQGDSSFYT
jgi:RNA polymerase sigma-70 factor (ECF subfamily)